jgi:hypothetical protein
MRPENAGAFALAKPYLNIELLGHMNLADDDPKHAYDTVNYTPVVDGRSILAAEFKFNAGICTVAYTYEYGKSTVTKSSHKFH